MLFAPSAGPQIPLFLRKTIDMGELLVTLGMGMNGSGKCDGFDSVGCKTANVVQTFLWRINRGDL